MDTKLSILIDDQYIKYDNIMEYSIYLYMKYKYRNNMVQTIVFDKYHNVVKVQLFYFEK